MTHSRTALVLGITGGVGGEIARALLQRGWHVRALRRGNAGPREEFADGPVEWLRGDALAEQDVVNAANGASLIVHAVNPPRYENWRQLAIPMLNNTLTAARKVDARIVFPGTIYNFGTDVFPVLRETSPQRPTTRKGAVRVEMEQMLERASTDGVRTLIVRAGDFFGPRAGNSWFSQGLISPGNPVRRVFYPGPFDIGHAWAYLPDLAATFCQLLDHEAQLADFDVYHFRGHYFERGVALAETICDVAGIDRSRIWRFPWWAATLASPFVNMLQEMREMRYLWRQAAELDNRKLLAVIGQEPHTPVDVAVRRALEGLGCLPAAGDRTKKSAGLSDSTRAARP